MSVVRTGQFRRDYKRALRQGKDVEKLKVVVRALCEGKPLGARYRGHRLTGRLRLYRECHIEPDWLLVYRVDAGSSGVTLVRTGSHSELFR